MGISSNIVYLIPLTRLFNSGYFIKRLLSYGMIKEMRYYADGGELGFPVGFAIGAVHFVCGYAGPMTISMYELRP